MMGKSLKEIQRLIKSNNNLKELEKLFDEAAKLCENQDELFKLHIIVINKALDLKKFSFAKKICADYIKELEVNNTIDHRLLSMREILIPLLKREKEDYSEEYAKLMNIAKNVRNGFYLAFIKIFLSLCDKVDIGDPNQEIKNAQDKLDDIDKYINLKELSQQEKKYFFRLLSHTTTMLAKAEENIAIEETSTLIISFYKFCLSNKNHYPWKKKDNLFYTTIYGYLGYGFGCLKKYEESCKYYEKCCKEFTEKGYKNSDYKTFLEEEFSRHCQNSVIVLFKAKEYELALNYCDFGLQFSQDCTIKTKSIGENPELLFLHVNYILSLLLKKEDTEETLIKLTKYHTIEDIIEYQLKDIEQLITKNRLTEAETLLNNVEKLCKKYSPEDKEAIQLQAQSLSINILQKKVLPKICLTL